MVTLKIDILLLVPKVLGHFTEIMLVFEIEMLGCYCFGLVVSKPGSASILLGDLLNHEFLASTLIQQEWSGTQESVLYKSL